MLHVDLTLPLLVLASPLVVLAALRIVASIADRGVTERSDALLKALEQIEPGIEDGSATSRSRSPLPASPGDASHLTDTNDSPQG